MMRTIRVVAGAAVLGLACGPALAQAQSSPVTISVDLAQKKASVSPMLYGLMTEEINHSYDGGLYAELVRNRTFHSDWQGIGSWVVVSKGDAVAHFSVDKTTGPSAAIPQSVKLVVENASAQAAAGLANEGYWGMEVHPGEQFRGSLYAKGTGAAMTLHIALVGNQTGTELAGTDLTVDGSQWAQHAFSLHAGEGVVASADNHLEITTRQPGTLWLQLVSLFPPTFHGRANGTRPDLMQLMGAMHPAFLRMPGGNYVEGDTLDGHFAWKKTIGPLVDRPGHPGTWSYASSDGFGLLEFLEWCQDLKMEPVLAVFAGYALNGQHVAAGPELDKYVQDALDEIEYVNGPADSPWGKVRAQDGHPEPFPLHFVEVGNEDNFDKSGSYDGRFAQFYKAIKARYPQLGVIATTKVTSVQPDVLDDHAYRTADEMFAEAHHYDAAPRTGPKIFVGEWATREGSPTTDMNAALADAAYMTGFERNADLIIMASYAPLLVNVNPGAMQWPSDLIGFNAASSYGSPSYYAQTMFSSCVGAMVPAVTVRGDGRRFFESVTADPASGRTCVKLVNATSLPQPVTLTIAGKGRNREARMQTLTAASTFATNTITMPKAIVPTTTTVAIGGGELKTDMPANSVVVLDVQ